MNNETIESVKKQVNDLCVEFYKRLEQIKINNYEMDLLVLYFIDVFKEYKLNKYGVDFKVDMTYQEYFIDHIEFIEMDKFKELYEILDDNISISNQVIGNFIYVMVQEYIRNENKFLDIVIELKDLEHVTHHDFKIKGVDKFEH